MYPLTIHHSPLITLTRVFALSLALMTFFSCKKDLSVKNPVSLSANTTAAPKDSNFVSFAIAAKAAKQVNNSHLVSGIITKKIIQSTGGLSGRPILDSLAVPDNVNPSFYIFNYVGGGYAIMPADKRVEPILSYSNNGYFPHSGALPWGLANWLSLNHKNMQLLRKNTTLKVPPGVAMLWNELAVVDSGRTKAVNQALPPPPPCEPTYSSQTVGPLLSTTWGQGAPYNYLCPLGNPQILDGYMVTGCVATAMAQVMYYWKTPTTYNWSLMPLSYNDNGINYTGNRDVAQLMVDIGKSVNMQYTDTASSPYISPWPFYSTISCTWAFKRAFNYSSSAEGSYDYLNVIGNLNAGEPVLLSGDAANAGGHEWVCDGWEQENYNWCPSNGSPGGGESWLYLDMNWGWDGLSNGWYYFNQWIVTAGTNTYNWQYSPSMTYNIHP